MPSQLVSSFVHFVTQWMSARISSLGSARNSSQVHVVGWDAPPTTANVQSAVGVCGVGPAESTGKSRTVYWHGGTRAFSRSASRLPWNPGDTKPLTASSLQISAEGTLAELADQGGVMVTVGVLARLEAKPGKEEE